MSGVVIIEDEDDMRHLIRVVLQAEGFNVVGEASTGRAGVAVVARTRPAGVVLDFLMTPENGLEVLPDIKAAWPETRVVLFTVVPDTDLEREARDLGASAVVRKGESLRDLAVALRSA